MDKHFREWLETQRLPMFDIRVATINERFIPADGESPCRFMEEAYFVFQKNPEKEVLFECALHELQPLIASQFKQLATPIGVLAVNTAIADLELMPWWGSAGPIIEEIRFLLREGVRVGMLRATQLNKPLVGGAAAAASTTEARCR